jgi:16S rRNA processing protein RimM
VVLGRVVGAHGIRGQLRIRYFGDGPENLLAVDRVFLADPKRGQDDPEPKEFQVVGGGQGRQGEARLALQGISDRDAAGALRGCWVLVGVGELDALPDGEHYWFELIGCRVESTTGQLIGTVRELWESGAHDLMVVERDDGRRVLVPTAGALLCQVNVSEGRIVVEDVPGLFEPI